MKRVLLLFIIAGIATCSLGETPGYRPTHLTTHPDCWVDGERSDLKLLDFNKGVLQLRTEYRGVLRLEVYWIGFARIDTMLYFGQVEQPYVIEMIPEQPAILHGYVRDRKGRSLRQAKVKIQRWGKQYINCHSKGFYELEIPAGRYDVTASESSARSHVTHTLDLKPGRATRQDFRLPVNADRRIEGTVVDSSGSPMANVPVKLLRLCDSTLTDRKGRFKFKQLKPQKVLVSAGGNGFRKTSTEVDLTRTERTAEVELVSCEPIYEGGTYQLTNPTGSPPMGGTGKLSGHIRDVYGEAIFGASIQIMETQRGAMVDYSSDGRYFVLGIESGSYTVRISSIGFGTIVVKDVEVHADKITYLNVFMDTEAVQVLRLDD